MKKIYSLINPTILLHIVVDGNFLKSREEIIPESNFLQLSKLSLVNGIEFKPHRHIEKEVTFSKFHAQEAWVVLSGRVEVIYFDLDDTEISRYILTSGETSITLLGGHNYRVLDDSRVLEFKSGPYLGVQRDKVKI